MNNLLDMNAPRGLRRVVHWPIEFIQQYLNAVSRVMNTYFASDLDVMSPEVKKILANPVDREKYVKAVETLNEGKEKEVTIELESGDEIILG